MGADRRDSLMNLKMVVKEAFPGLVVAVMLLKSGCDSDVLEPVEMVCFGEAQRTRGRVVDLWPPWL